jgi:hypothetical protein
MQEVIKLVETINHKLDKVLTFQSSLSRTHAQYLREEWISSEQVMSILKIGISSLKTLKRNGKLPYSKVNGVSYFSTMDVENLLKHHYHPTCDQDRYSTIKNPSYEEG